MNWQRTIIGVLAIGCLIVGSVNFLLAGSVANAGLTTGLLIRIGTVLAMIWLAMPQLKSMQTKVSILVLLIAIALLVMAASRPNLFRVAAGVIAVGLALNWLLSWIGKFTRPPGGQGSR